MAATDTRSILNYLEKDESFGLSSRITIRGEGSFRWSANAAASSTTSDARTLSDTGRSSRAWGCGASNQGGESGRNPFDKRGDGRRVKSVISCDPRTADRTRKPTGDHH